MLQVSLLIHLDGSRYGSCTFAIICNPFGGPSGTRYSKDLQNHLYVQCNDATCCGASCKEVPPESCSGKICVFFYYPVVKFVFFFIIQSVLLVLISYLYQYAISCDLDTDDSLFLDLLVDCALNHVLLFVGHNWNGRKGY